MGRDAFAPAGPTTGDNAPTVLGTQFLYNDAGSGLHCHGGSLLVTTRGDLLASWYAYPEVEHAHATIMTARRPRGSAVWLSTRPQFVSEVYSAGNPLLFEEPNGRVWLFFVLLEGSYWTDAFLHGSYSDDEGETWSRPAGLVRTRGLMIRHPPIRCSAGDWLLPAYNERSHHTLMLAARPPFVNWRTVHAFDDLELIQPALVREVGQLTLLFRPVSDPRVVWRSHSTDEGQRWSPPLRTTVPNPLSGVSAFQAGGRLGLVYNHTEQHARRPLSLAVSEDGGRNWSGPRLVDNAADELSYPSFVCAPDGTLHGLYTYNRRMMKYVHLGRDWAE